MKLFRVIFLGLFLLCGYVRVSAQDTPIFRLDTLVKCKIHFRHDRSSVDSTYRDNQASLSKIRAALQDVTADSLNAISSIIVEGSASPIGHEVYNYRLSLRRARAAEKFLRTVRGLEGFDIEVFAKGEDWEEFTNDIRRSYFRWNRNALLKILESDIPDLEKERKVIEMDNGRTWNYLAGFHMKSSRHSVTAVVIKKSRIIDTLDRVAPIVSHAVLEERPLVFEPEFRQAAPDQAKVPVASVRTNLLVPALNVGAEVPIGNRWSMAADYYYPWIWPAEDNKNCFELLGWSLEGRYWFGKDRQPQDRLKGHSLGVYFAGGYYDLESNFRGMQGAFISPGLDYTYSMGIGRNKRVHLQFTVAVGYIRSWGKTYNVFEDGGALYPDEGTLIWDYFGPTKAAVSIVVPFYKKEGRR